MLLACHLKSDFLLEIWRENHTSKYLLSLFSSDIRFLFYISTKNEKNLISLDGSYSFILESVDFCGEC